MKVGRKSLLFGVHQFIWHPITVLIAWIKLYGWPTWKEFICIVIHDWGYWECSNMDGVEGEKHPVKAAIWADNWLGHEYFHLCLLHSRHFARSFKLEPSKLCWADKLSVIYDPWWFYLPRAWASGELFEYRQLAADAGFVPLTASHRQWFNWMKDKLETLGREQRGNAVPYVNHDHRK